MFPRPFLRPSLTPPFLGALLCGSATGCGSGGAPAPSAQVRDSAGVTIGMNQHVPPLPVVNHGVPPQPLSDVGTLRVPVLFRSVDRDGTRIAEFGTFPVMALNYIRLDREREATTEEDRNAHIAAVLKGVPENRARILEIGEDYVLDLFTDELKVQYVRMLSLTPPAPALP